MKISRWSSVLVLYFCLTFPAGLGLQAAQADDYGVGDDTPQPAAHQDGGYMISDAPATDDADAVAPVRMARFSLVIGNVSWRLDEDSDWSTATVNLPLRQDAQIWVDRGSRAEIQFDDGSLLRLGSNALVTLQTLYSDPDSEFTELKMNNGLASLRLKRSNSAFQVDTPFVSIKSSGPSKVRIGVSDFVEVAVRDGLAGIDGAQGHQDLDAGSYITIHDADDPYNVRDLPGNDRWETWNDQLDQQYADADAAPSHGYLPPNVAIAAGNLDQYGTWHDDDRYGHVWAPNVADPDWQPYHAGHWVWVDPFGWTWVSNESWGWAPYHYGTWVNEPYGWAWVPGPENQYWCPAVVHFSSYDGQVAWCPLAPQEVIYPPAYSDSRRNLALGFAIVAAASYYAGRDACYPRPWRSDDVNNSRGGRPTDTTINNITIVVNNNHFVPSNARAGGASITASVGFGNGGADNYQRLPRGSTTQFAKGTAMGGIVNGRPVSGPAAIKPTRQSYSSTRIVATPAAIPARAMQRPVVQASLPPAVQVHVQRSSGGATHPKIISLPAKPGKEPGSPGGTAHNAPPAGVAASHEPSRTPQVHEPQPREPAANEPAPRQPRGPAANEPASKEPTIKEPASKEPVRAPAPKEPAAKEPAPKEPVKEPATKEPEPKEPAKESATKEPAPKEPVKEPAPKKPATEDQATTEQR